MKIPTIDRYIRHTLNSKERNVNHQKAVIYYLLRVCDHKGFKQLTLDITAAQRKLLRMNIRADASLMLNFKLEALQSIKYHSNMFTMPLNYNALKLLQPAQLRLLKSKLKMDIPSVEEVRKECGVQLAELKSYIGKFVNRKMTFVSKGNQLDKSDLSNQLTYCAIQTYYNELPFITGLHLVNKVKSKIHSEGINIIKYYTTKKRQRMVEQEGQYVGTVVSVNQGEDLDLLERIDTKQSDPYERIDSDVTMNNLFDYYSRPNGDRGKKYEALCIMSLQDHAKFVEWYNAGHNTSYETTEDVYDAIHSSTHFKECVRQFFKATKNSWDSFLDEIKDFYNG